MLTFEVLQILLIVLNVSAMKVPEVMSLVTQSVCIPCSCNLDNITEERHYYAVYSTSSSAICLLTFSYILIKLKLCYLK
jgi:hypothetical protein